MSIARQIAEYIASTTQSGPVELATQAEVDSGTDEDRAVTPDTLANTITWGGLIDVQVFTSSGTWTKPTGARLVEVHCVGGGGGGAGAQDLTGSEYRIAGGGGGGGYATGMFLASALDATESVTIGAGGAGGAAGNNAGSAGADTDFATFASSPYVRGSKGNGGTASAADSRGNGGSGGAGGAVSGAISGSAWFCGGANSRGGSVTSIFCGMQGGGSGGPYGGPHLLQQTYTSPASRAGASPVIGAYGVGGGGAYIRNSASSKAGGTGYKGLCVVKTYA